MAMRGPTLPWCLQQSVKVLERSNVLAGNEYVAVSTAMLVEVAVVEIVVVENVVVAMDGVVVLVVVDVAMVVVAVLELVAID